MGLAAFNRVRREREAKAKLEAEQKAKLEAKKKTTKKQTIIKIDDNPPVLIELPNESETEVAELEE